MSHHHIIVTLYNCSLFLVSFSSSFPLNSTEPLDAIGKEKRLLNHCNVLPPYKKEYNSNTVSHFNILGLTNYR